MPIPIIQNLKSKIRNEEGGPVEGRPVGIGYIEDDHFGMEGKERRGRSHEVRQGAAGGAKKGQIMAV